MPRFFVLLLLTLPLVLPAHAAAAGCKAPQGTSAVDQYCETIPGSKGDTSPGSGGGNGSGGGGGTISDRQAAALVAQGKDGEALARSLGKDPAALKGGSKGSRARGAKLRKASTGSADAPDVPSSNPFTAVTRAAGGSATIGPFFFLVLFGVVLLMLGSAWVGWRRNSSS